MLTTLVRYATVEMGQAAVILAEVTEMREDDVDAIDKYFTEFRRKIRHSEVLSAATERLLRNLRFSGRLCIVVQNGNILKSGYEEGYFTRRQDDRMIN